MTTGTCAALLRISLSPEAYDGIRDALTALAPIMDALSEADLSWPEDRDAFYRVAKILRQAINQWPVPPENWTPGRNCYRPNKDGAPCANRISEGHVACHQHATAADNLATRTWQNKIHSPYKRVGAPAPPSPQKILAVQDELLQMIKDLA